MSTTLNNKVLVLNKAWQVVDTTTVKEALGKIITGSAKVVGRDYGTYDFDTWVDTWSDLSELAKMEDMEVINTAHLTFPIPEVIVNQYGGFRNMSARFSRRNLYVRDNYTCQYCNLQSDDRKVFNLDHVVPKARGGRMVWENIVLSCIPCNTKKASRTPKEAGMKLNKQPAKPHWTQLRGKIGMEQIPEFWKSFVDAAYWNVELKE
jgi:hypothetical protein